MVFLFVVSQVRTVEYELSPHPFGDRHAHELDLRLSRSFVRRLLWVWGYISNTSLLHAVSLICSLQRVSTTPVGSSIYSDTERHRSSDVCLCTEKGSQLVDVRTVQLDVPYCTLSKSNRYGLTGFEASASLNTINRWHRELQKKIR